MPPSLRFLLVSTFVASASARVSGAEPAPDIADMKVEDRRAGGDEKKRYFIIGKPVEPPAAGWRLLFVLPGGPGSADFQPFVTRIAKFALPESYLVVQLVAPVWSEEQAKEMVWPGEKLRPREARFTTPDFLLAVKGEVEKAHRIDARYVFTLTWSSSGTNGYALSLMPKAGITGSFIAMSVFKPGALPALSTARGKPYYIYHSAGDFIPIAQAREAQAALEKAGARVELKTYEGGHGWHGNAMADIRAGMGLARNPRRFALVSPGMECLRITLISRMEELAIV